MADAVVEFLLANLKELLLYHVDLLSDVKDQVESLHRELNLIQAFLKDTREKRDEYEYVRVLVRQITDVTFEAEDIIDTFVVNASMRKARSGFGRVIHAFNDAQMLRNVAQQIDDIKSKVKDIYDKKLYGIESLQGGESIRKGGSNKKRAPIVEEENVVGFDEEAKIIVNLLTKGPKDLEVISVVGMGGLGKTTLAKKVYADPSIEYLFYTRAWIYVSQQYSRKEVFLGLLDCIGQIRDEVYKMNDDRLAEELGRHLRDNRYLIVIDDVWTIEAWNDIKMAFPKTANGSRILLTSRHTDVALHANPYSTPHHLRFLNDEESWELLSRKVFREGSCPVELEELGRRISSKCYGLPLAIVVVSGLLLKRKARDSWNKVAESVSSYVARDPKQCMDILALSYKHLPDHLKVCFIYFGAFPEDFEIPVSKLLKLWVAEGFIQHIGQECLEDIAEEYLVELVDRSLVIVAKKRANGRIKSCRIHDMLRDLCVREGREAKVLHVINGIPNPATPHSIPDYYRRLCVHSHVVEFISSKPSGPLVDHVRTLLCFSVDEKDLPREHTSVIQETFKLVRIMDFKSITFPRFPNEIVQLIHLRFLSLSGQFKVLPSSISSLWNLQTLIVETMSRNLDIQADIFKMLQFRHLHTSGLSRLHGPRTEARKNNEDPFVRRNIQTICTIVPESCTENILARTPNLRKLGICGKLATLVEERGGVSLFDNLAKLDHLETLKCLNETFPLPPCQCSIPGLPQSYKFPPKLKKITLSGTLLDWAHISTLGMLPFLEVLKLKQHAFKGSRWEPLDGGFRLLRVFHLERSDLEHWSAFSHHFPRLERLILRHCASLKEIPFGLANVPGLQYLELHWPSSTTASSARFIQKRKEGSRGMLNSSFKLSIYPPNV